MKPNSSPIQYRVKNRLSDMLARYNQVINVTGAEHGLITLQVAFHHATKDEVVTHTIQLPNQSTVADVISNLKTKVELSHPNVELRLLVVQHHVIKKILSFGEKIEYKDRKSLQAEEIPEEEKNLGPSDRLIFVQHFTRGVAQNQLLIQNFGKPFILVIHEGETSTEIKGRIQKKLQVPDEEFYMWKFALLSLGRPVYLQDTDVLSSCFQVVTTWKQYLGLEHSSTAPEGAHSANQNRHSYEKPVKIYK